MTLVNKSFVVFLQILTHPRLCHRRWKVQRPLKKHRAVHVINILTEQPKYSGYVAEIDLYLTALGQARQFTETCGIMFTFLVCSSRKTNWIITITKIDYMLALVIF